MRNWTTRIALAGLLAWGSTSTADEGHSLLNTVGRYLGVGYTHNGYHSANNGRLGVIERNHPSSSYPSSHLTHIYQPQSYARPNQPYQYTMPQVHGGVVVGQTPTAIVPAPKPVGPPPEWLNPYLRDGKKPTPEEVEAVEIPERTKTDTDALLDEAPSPNDDDLLLLDDDLLDGDLLDNESRGDGVSLELQLGPDRSNRYKQATIVGRTNGPKPVR